LKQEVQIVLSGEHSLEEAVNLLQDRLCSERLCFSLRSSLFTSGLPTRTLCPLHSSLHHYMWAKAWMLHSYEGFFQNSTVFSKLLTVGRNTV